MMAGGSVLTQGTVLHIIRRQFSILHTLRKQAEKATEVLGRPYKELRIGVPKEVWQNEKRLAWCLKGFCYHHHCVFAD